MTESLTDQQVRACVAAAKEAALRGARQLEEWRGRFSAKEKGRADMVTEADFAAQQAIYSYLQETFPGHGFLGEEDTHLDKKNLSLPANAPPTWIVDPLDGTANYVHDCPCYCVSIGLMAAGELVVGVIYDPRQNEMYAAAKGGLAELNGKPIRVSQVPAMSQALISTGFPPDLEAQERNLAWWRNFSYKAQALRRTGSTALNLAYVACGRFDAYWAFDNYAWDVAAGIVLVREAGGVVTRIDGSKVDPFKTDLLAGNPAVHAEMLECLRKG
jgi:myo-inositol-1(or 4)-monophosphatase